MTIHWLGLLEEGPISVPDKNENDGLGDSSAAPSRRSITSLFHFPPPTSPSSICLHSKTNQHINSGIHNRQSPHRPHRRRLLFSSLFKSHDSPTHTVKSDEEGRCLERGEGGGDYGCQEDEWYVTVLSVNLFLS